MPILHVVSKGEHLEVVYDANQAHIVNAYVWCIQRVNSCKYAIANTKTPAGNHTTVKLHRLIMRPPKGMHVDHINGNGLDNRLCNLRLCTRSENMRNRKTSKLSRTGYKGVTKVKDPRGPMYQARILVKGVRRGLGLHATAEAAARAYDKAALTYFGAFARVNFPNK